jgi:hypothetical protein
MKTAAVKLAPAQPQAVVMACAQCGTRITIISLDTNPYPVKLPGFCPCCLHQIGEYQMLERSVV